MEYLLIGAVSASILAYELLLSRILAVHYWSYFASMIVSLAMLGFAASGTALFVVSRGKERRLSVMARWMLIAFSISIPVCYKLSEHIHCMPLVVLWDIKQMGLFAANYLVLSLPFFLGGFIIGHYFLRKNLPAGRIYFSNMFGSGVGVGIGLLLINVMPPSYALHVIPLPVLAVSFLRYRGFFYRAASGIAAAAVLILMVMILPLPEMSEYKGLSRILLMPDTRIENRTWSPFGYACVVDSPYLRYAPGLSLTSSGTIPSQKAVFTDGDSMSVVCESGDPDIMRVFFGSMLSSLPYQLFSKPGVLVVGAGAGMDVLNAMIHGASHVDALEIDPNIVKLMRGPLSDFSGHLYGRNNVRVLLEDGRAFCHRTPDRYDLIILPGGGSPFASATGTSAQDANYCLTEQGLCDFLSILGPGGAVVIDSWLNVPPRDGMKVFATALAALKEKGVTDPRDHLLFVRSLRTCLLMVFRDPVKHVQIAGARGFCEHYSFDRIFHPGIEASAANRFNRIEGAPHFNMCRQILDGNEDNVFRRHIFDIRPPCDDRPYFSHFFKWAALPELVKRLKQNVAVQIGWGYMFLLITLLQAVLLGAFLIFVPLVVSKRTVNVPRSFRWRAYAYFSAIGLGFMFLEIGIIQQFTRFMRHPIFAFGFVLTIILLGSGLGALASAHRLMRPRLVFFSLVGLAVIHIVLWLTSIRLGSEKVFYVDVIVVAAMAFFMGSPFPQAIRLLRAHVPSLIPWVWGINGFVSVLAVLLAGLLSISFGLAVICAVGAFFYFLATFLFPRLRAEKGAQRSAPS